MTTTPTVAPPTKPTLQTGKTRMRELQAEKIVETAIQLRRRIEERFPGSGLGNLAVEVVNVANEAAVRSKEIRQPNYWLRTGSVLLIVLMAGLLGVIATKLHSEDDPFQLNEFVQTFEAAIGSVVFLGLAIIYLWSVEGWWKQRRALSAIRELRAMAHIVDMHQLTKSPESAVGSQPTASSPKRTLTQFELSRYLDYCIELLSLINKIGAIYVQEFPDAVALEAVDQLSDLTNGLSRNIWQKVMLLDRAVEKEG